MKCPVCVENNQRSTVYVPSWSTGTGMGHQDYYDADGACHSHDPNLITSEYSCSNGHRWAVTTMAACPAGDYEGSQEVRILTPGTKHPG